LASLILDRSRNVAKNVAVAITDLIATPPELNQPRFQTAPMLFGHGREQANHFDDFSLERSEISVVPIAEIGRLFRSSLHKFQHQVDHPGQIAR
jgi:hypothetical protein